MKKLFYSVTTGSVLLMLVVFMQACKQDSKVEPSANMTQPKLENVKAENGILSFKSLESLVSSLQTVKKHQKSFDWLEKQYPNFTSSYKAYKGFSDTDIQKTNGDLSSYSDYVTLVYNAGEAYAEPTVDGYLLSQLVNKNGLLFVGNDVYKFTYDNYYYV